MEEWAVCVSQGMNIDVRSCVRIVQQYREEFGDAESGAPGFGSQPFAFHPHAWGTVIC